MKKTISLFACVLLALCLAVNAGCSSGGKDASAAAGSSTTKPAGGTTAAPAGGSTTDTAGDTTTAPAGGSTTGTAASPVLKTYDALKDFNKNNAGPVWFYEVTNRDGAWEKVAEYHEEWDGFFGTGAYGNAGVYGGGSCSGLAPAYEAVMGIAHDACYKFVCPDTGNITIAASRLESKSDPSAKGVEVSIVHNDKKIWSTTFDKSGADGAGKSVPEQKLSVKKGDVIRFKGHSLDTAAGSNGSFVWGIQVTYTG